MKSTPAALVAYMAGDGTLAHLFKLTRTDGTVLAVTDYDQDLIYGGMTYLASVGMDASAIQTTAALSVDNLDVKGFLAALGVNEADISSGLWDYCEILIYRVTPSDLGLGDEKLLRGWVGDISSGDDKFANQVRSLAQKLQSNFIEIVTENCKADLFDGRCKLTPIEGVTKFSGVAVSTILAAQRQFTCAALTSAADFFTAGKVTWETGDNAGLSMEIKAHASGGNILLQAPMPYPIAVADTATFFAGCLKRYQEDCNVKFGNTDNFRGFPFLPGNDALARGPQ